MLGYPRVRARHHPPPVCEVDTLNLYASGQFPKEGRMSAAVCYEGYTNLVLGSSHVQGSVSTQNIYNVDGKLNATY